MTRLLCTILSAAAFFFSGPLGGHWALAWLAPLPLLWLAFGRNGPWPIFLLAWLAKAVGATDLLPVYGGLLPAGSLAVAIVAPSLAFALSLLLARLVYRRLGGLAAALAFATLAVTVDYLAAWGPNGTAGSPAYGQVPMPLLIQGAALFGLWWITFLLALLPAGLAATLRGDRLAPALLALGLVAVNVGFGAWRLAQPPAADPAGGTLRIGLAVDDALTDASFVARADLAQSAIDAYLAAVGSLTAAGARVVLLPEKLAVLDDPWRQPQLEQLSAAAVQDDITLVAGFDDRSAAGRFNSALALTPSFSAVYHKRRFVPGLEQGFTAGSGPLSLPDGVGVSICKDMDFPAMISAGARALHPTVMLVPAWDFSGDADWHARLAALRGVEDGFAVARAAKQGLLSLSDAEGRMLEVRHSDSSGMITLIGDLPRGPGRTFYLLLGDSFAWLCITASLLLLGAALRAPVLRRGRR